jgi:hypothetical protein
VAAIWTIMLELSGAIMLGLVVYSVVLSIRRQDHTLAVRTLFIEVPVSIAATAAIVAVVALAVGVSDAVAGQILGTVPSSAIDAIANRWPEVIGSVSIVGLVGGLLFILGGFLVWLELLVRSSLIYLVVMLAPVFLALRVLPGLQASWKKYAETAAAIIFSKVVVAIALALGVALIGGGGTAGSGAQDAGLQIGQLMAGVTLLGLAAFAPFVLLRFAPVLEAAAVAQGISRMPARGAQQAMQAGYYGSSLSRLAGSAKASRTGGGSGRGSLAGAAGSGAGGGGAGAAAGGVGVAIGAAAVAMKATTAAARVVGGTAASTASSAASSDSGSGSGSGSGSPSSLSERRGRLAHPAGTGNRTLPPPPPPPPSAGGAAAEKSTRPAGGSRPDLAGDGQ